MHGQQDSGFASLGPPECGITNHRPGENDPLSVYRGRHSCIKKFNSALMLH